MMILEQLGVLYDCIKPGITPIVSGAIDGAMIGTATAITGIVILEWIQNSASLKKTPNENHLVKGMMYLATTVLSGACGGVGGAVYRLGTDLLMLQPTINFALAASSVGI